MTPQQISALRTELPELFDPVPYWDWPPNEKVVILGEDDLVDGDPFEDWGTSADYPTPSTDITSEIKRPWEPPIDRDLVRSDELDQLADAIIDSLPEGNWPGRPTSRVGYTFVPERCAFYLPWHYFDSNVWGIYLIVEGIELIGRQLHSMCWQHLSRSECMNVAKIFLFHHEAYHNAVETFSARLEVMHRRSFYNSGIRKIYDQGPQSGAPHEEALANSYAALKVKSECFLSEPSVTLRQKKRKYAFEALVMIFARSHAPYRDAHRLLSGRSRKTFTLGQHSFQEECLTTGTGLRSVNSSIWESALHALHPSLSRNGAYSYVIGKRHPLAHRINTSIRYFDRRKFIKRLQDETGGVIEPGGRHQIFRTPGGKRVPIPTGDLKMGTATSILKECGLKVRYRTVGEFLRSP